MKRVLLTIFVTAVVLLLIEAGTWLAGVYSGAYNISTSNHDNAILNWALDTGMTRSVQHHAKHIPAPALNKPTMVQEGFEHFDHMCVGCHGAPGVPPEEIAKGLWPHAPNLAKTVPTWTRSQLFWITKNGIKFSAMPAWGPTHTDNQLWAMVAFMEILPRLSPSEYQDLRAKTGAGGQKTEPSHAEPSKP